MRKLTRQEVINVIERKGNTGIPMFMTKWWGEGLYERYGEALVELDKKYPDDIYPGWFNMPGADVTTIEGDPSYRWGYKADYSEHARHSIGGSIELLNTWDEFDDFLNDFPDANSASIFDGVIEELKDPALKDTYKLCGFWCLYHERLWQIRGMENLMMDYYDEMDNLKILVKKLTDFYKVIIDRASALGFDGMFSSDDLGHQGGPMMSPEIFEELYYPAYKEVIGYAHSKNLHFFLHSCGDNTKVMKYLIDAGLDVFHPIQKGCMDLEETYKKFGDKISFLYGIDVQALIPFGTTDEIRAEIDYIAKVFEVEKGKGGLLLASGNGILGDTPLENIEAMCEQISKLR